MMHISSSSASVRKFDASNTVELVRPLYTTRRMDGRTFEIEFEVDDVEVELTHGNKIGNAWEGIGVQP